MTCELTVILPAFLEEENLRLLLPRIKEHCSQLTNHFEILVIDTMTPMDGSLKVCRGMGVTYISRLGGNKYGDAIRTGISHSRGASVVFMDADGSHPPSVLEDLYPYKNQTTVVAASRYIEGGYTENSSLLILMSRMVNLGYRLVLGLKCKDVSNSFKLYPGKELRELSLKCDNFDIVEEILFKVIKKNPTFVIKEVPFSFKKRMFGKTKRNLLKFVFTYIITLIRLRLM
jgi:dolichol-phosphate mannosyltransferase